MLPKFGEIRVVIGEPIEYDQYKDWSPEETLTILENRVAELLATARRKINRDLKTDTESVLQNEIWFFESDRMI